MLRKLLPGLLIPAVMSYGWALDLSDYKLVDLTHPCNADTIYWPTSPSKSELTVLAYGETPGGWFYAANSQLPPTGEKGAGFIFRTTLAAR